MRPGILLNHSLSNGLLPHGKAACMPSHYPPSAIQTWAQLQECRWRAESYRGVYPADRKAQGHLCAYYPTGTIPKVFTCSVIVDIDAGGEFCLDLRAKKVGTASPEGKAGSARAPPGTRPHRGSRGKPSFLKMAPPSHQEGPVGKRSLIKTRIAFTERAPVGASIARPNSQEED